MAMFSVSGRFLGFLLLLIHTAPFGAQPLVNCAIVVESASGLKQQYDYIVVGGGTSGLTVANRLTEDRSGTLRERYLSSSDENDLTVLTTYSFANQEQRDKLEPGVLVPGLPAPAEYSRNYMSVPQPGLNNRTQAVYSAAAVGGGTVINGLFFNRGSAADYDAWEKLGNHGWGWKGLLPYFKKSETFTPPPAEISSEYPISSDLGPHGTDGPVQSSFPNYQYPVLRYFYKAWNSIGVPSNPQPNAGRAVDAFYSTLSISALNQSRSSADTAYFRPIAGKRLNFHLLPLHSVTKIVIDKKSKRATGVQYVSRNNTSIVQTVRAGKEVIVAAGAPRSPQILQLSGIGHKKLVADLGIEVIEDLPGVGYNFHDQPAMFTQATYDYSKYPFPSPAWFFSNQSWSAQQLAVYYENRTGPLTQAYLSGTTVAFLSLRTLTPNYTSLLSFFHTTDPAPLLPPESDPSLLEGYRAQQRILLSDYASPDTAVHELAASGQETIPLVLLRPLSRGSILVNTSDPLADPVFDYNTFGHPIDIKIFIHIYKTYRRFIAAEPWKAVGLTEVLPGPAVPGDADLEIEKAIRNLTQSTWSHPVGSCAMMPRRLGGVVDARLRVYGIGGLRVVDASIMPIVPGSHTSSTVYAVAEKWERTLV
ncbi:MAG: hypothetical protein Q9201_002919 [Fulgogasparrea decipioides]